MKMTEIVENTPFVTDVYKSYEEPVFPRMPIMYLELLENKNKIKQQYKRGCYVPPLVQKPILKKNTQQNIETVYENEQTRSSDTEVESQFNDDFTSNFNKQYYEKQDASHGEEKLEDSPVEHASKQIDSLLGINENTEQGFKHKPQLDLKNDVNAPTLQELQQQKKITIDKEYRYAEDDEELQKERNAMYFKYEVLRRMHPTVHIPDFTPYSDPKLMKQKYDMLTEKLTLNTTIDNWKRYLIIGVMVCEVVLGKLNFDMEGFSQQQITQMSTYDQLLVEIAEKNQKRLQSKWSPEMRLCLTMGVNILVFVGSKTIFNNSGYNLLGTINSMTSGLVTTPPTNMKEP